MTRMTRPDCAYTNTHTSNRAAIRNRRGESKMLETDLIVVTANTNTEELRRESVYPLFRDKQK